MTLKQQAVQTAGERLERLETWMRRTCLAVVVTAVMTTISAAVAIGMTWKYIQVSSAIRESTANFKLDFPEPVATTRFRR